MSLSAGWSAAGAAVGALCGVGLLLLWHGIPRRSRIDLTARLAPYLRDAPEPSRILHGEAGAGSWLPQMVRAGLRQLLRRSGSMLGDQVSIRSRLLRAGRSPDVEALRARQVLWAVAGGGFGLLAGWLLWTANRIPVQATVVLLIGSMSTFGSVPRVLLNREVTHREQRILVQFPTVAELLALSVGAGEGAVAALERVGRSCAGDLADELRTCLADARAGASLPVALQGLSNRTGLAVLQRFVDGLVIALERGTPLAEVLRAQAQDVRDETRRILLEAAGTKEIGMLIPVVFLVLPVTVVFAVYPATAYLNSSF